MATEAATGMLLSNHSYGIASVGWRRNADEGNRWEFWGRPGENEEIDFGYYSSLTQIIDSITYNAPFYLPVWSWLLPWAICGIKIPLLSRKLLSRQKLLRKKTKI